MKPNPMIEQCASERHGDCCAHKFCRTCGSHVIVTMHKRSQGQ